MTSLPEHAARTVEDFQRKIAELEEQSRTLKTSINLLCSMYGAALLYEPGEINGAGDTRQDRRPAALSFRPDEFFNRPLAACVKEILEARKAREMGPATAETIFASLKEGGYAFESRDDETAFRGMQISISKNTAAFNRLPNGMIGLAEWYSQKRTLIRRRRVTLDDVPEGANSDQSEDPAEGEDAEPLAAPQKEEDEL
ncbi:hypothetical protein [Pseudacidovorax intermedius]|uniref:hypothetical protein n=1 Tax=Pseudacidovorax intermedius TaxID=433924 RepID=UPI0026F21EE3|nr:hypothetical protein [Pseudacidovorax intermedius]